MAYPPIDIVDEHDNVIGSAMTVEAWKKGHRHRGVYILLEDDQGRTLLQKRAPTMTLFPNCWDISAGGHVDSGMTYEEAARAELAEELNLHDVPLTRVGKYYVEEVMPDERIGNIFFTVFRARLVETPHKLGKDEVSEVKWFTPEELRELLNDRPDRVAASLRRVYDHI